MADLTAKLSQQLNRQVNDATGLTGKYDINMYWMVAPIMMNSSEPPPGGSGPDLAEALQSQLGLKLNAKKGPVDTLVVDHAEKVPIEN